MAGSFGCVWSALLISTRVQLLSLKVSKMQTFSKAYSVVENLSAHCWSDGWMKDTVVLQNWLPKSILVLDNMHSFRLEDVEAPPIAFMKVTLL